MMSPPSSPSHQPKKKKQRPAFATGGSSQVGSLVADASAAGASITLPSLPSLPHFGDSVLSPDPVSTSTSTPAFSAASGSSRVGFSVAATASTAAAAVTSTSSALPLPLSPPKPTSTSAVAPFDSLASAIASDDPDPEAMDVNGTTYASVVARQIPQTQHPLTVVSSPLKNALSRLPPREEYQYFDRRETLVNSDGVGMVNYVFYKGIPDEIVINIALEEARLLLQVDADASGSPASARLLPIKQGYADFLKEKLRGKVPRHIPLRFNNPKIRPKIEPVSTTKGKGTGRGKKSQHAYVVYFTGWCGYKIGSNCKTVFYVGFDYEALDKMVKGTCSIALKATFLNSCQHVKGGEAGQCRGSERQRRIDKIVNAEGEVKNPKAVVEGELSEMHPDAYQTNNFEGTLGKVSTAYNIPREAKQQIRRKYGLTDCKLDNIARARTNIGKVDIKMRTNIKDTTTDYAGILRGFSLDDETNPSGEFKNSCGFRAYLFNKTSIVLMHNLNKTGKSVFNYDGTGNVTTSPITLPQGEIVQHHILSIMPANAVHATGDLSLASRLMNPKILSEYISNRNSGDDHVRNLSLMTQAELHIFGEIIAPLLFSTDCAGQLQTAALITYAKDDQVSTRIKYHNIICVLLLRYEYLKSSGAANTDAEVAAKEAHGIMKKHFPTLLHDCKCHAIRAIKRWTCSTDRPAEFTGNSYFEKVLVYLAHGVTGPWLLSESLARIAVVVTILSAETIPSPSFDADHPTRAHHHQGDATATASRIGAFINRETTRSQVVSSDSVEKAVEAILKVPAAEDKFSGYKDYIGPSYRRAVDENLVYSQVYLKDKDLATNKGTLRIVIFYGTDVNDEDETMDNSVISAELLKLTRLNRNH